MSTLKRKNIMTIDDIMKYFGSTYEFEKQTGFKHSNVCHWKKKGKVPVTMQLKLHKMTHDALQIDRDLLE